MFPKTS
jgi:hypothetical protein